MIFGSTHFLMVAVYVVVEVMTVEPFTKDKLSDHFIEEILFVYQLMAVSCTNGRSPSNQKVNRTAFKHRFWFTLLQHFARNFNFLTNKNQDIKPKDLLKNYK